MVVAANLTISDYLEDKLLNHTLLIAEFPHSAIVGLKVHLYTSNPGQDDSGAEVDDTAAPSYVPQILPSWDEHTLGGLLHLVNSADVDFLVAAEVWGTVTHAAIKDNAGNLFFYGQIDVSTTVSVNHQFKFPASDVNDQYLEVHLTVAQETVLEQLLLRHPLLHTEYLQAAIGTEIKVALWVGEPGNGGVEVDNGTTSYERTLVTFHKDADVFKNDGPVVFPVAQESWGAVDWYSLHYDVLAARWQKNFPIATAIAANKQFIIPDGAITIELT